jgi:predicted metal-dependent enzyme (double-stranded beta helix superfamily)
LRSTARSRGEAGAPVSGSLLQLRGSSVGRQAERRMTLELDRVLADCVAAAADSSPEAAIREVVTRAVSEPSALVRTLGEPSRAEVQRLHVSDALTVLNVVWAPEMTLMPHDHRMWAVIGVYCGRENNIFWRRHRDHPAGLIEAAGAKSLGPREACPLGRDVIHSVTNPTRQFTGAIHVYGGDFFSTARSEWDPQTLEEHAYDVEKNLRLFEEANALSAS